MEEEKSEPLDAHVRAAEKMFRDVGFNINAMQFKRPPEALAALRRFNGVPDGMKTPFAWGYFPSEWFRDNWRKMYG